MGINGKKVTAFLGGIMIVIGGGMAAIGYSNDHMWDDYYPWVEPCEVGGPLLQQSDF